MEAIKKYLYSKVRHRLEAPENWKMKLIFDTTCGEMPPEHEIYVVHGKNFDEILDKLKKLYYIAGMKK